MREADADALIRRVILDTELKREYQQFLQEHNRSRSDSDGRPDRSPEEIHRWAVDHDLPDKDGHVQFPDARIEYEDRDGRLRTLDLEVETINYRGGHAGPKHPQDSVDTVPAPCAWWAPAESVEAAVGAAQAAMASPAAQAANAAADPSIHASLRRCWDEHR